MTDTANNSPLSSREFEVLKAVAKGSSNQEIAAELLISVNTVRVHLRNIFEKLQVQSRTEATMRAIQEGWLTPTLSENAAAPESEGSMATATATTTGLPATNWRKGYFAMALLAALLVLLTPVFRSMGNQAPGNPITDQPQTEAFSAAETGSDRWKLRAEMPTARSRLAVAAFANQLYLIGGDKTSGTTGLLEIFEPQSGRWQEGAPKPTPAANIQAVVIGRQIYVPGGCSAEGQVTDRLEIYDPAQNVWETGASLPLPLCAYAAAAYNQELYLIGGWDGTVYLDSVYIYNPQNNVWRTSASPYPLKIGFAAAAILNDKIYVAGGFDGQKEYAAVNAFNPVEETWHAGPAMLFSRGGLSLVASGENLYAIGGGWTNVLSANEMLPAGKSAWQEIETPYVSQWRNLGATVSGSDIFAVGGWNDEHLNTVLSYRVLYRVFIPLSN